MKLITACMLLLSCSGRAIACDVCGASGAGQSMGLLPVYSGNFIGLQYQYRAYHSTHPPTILEHDGGKTSNEVYQTMQLWGKASIGKRIQLFAFLPYHSNTQHQDGNTQTYKGIGDVSAMAGATILKPADKSVFKHTLIAGMGIKAPTGKRTTTDVTGENDLLNLQLGTGSWDGMLYSNYTISHKNAGINTEVSYTLTTPDRSDYKYGDRLAAAAQFFYRCKMDKLMVIPQAGMRMEHTLHDYDNFTKKWLVEETGGTLAFAFTGMQIYYSKIGLQATLNIPVHNDLAQGYVQAKGRADIGLLFLFK